MKTYSGSEIAINLTGKIEKKIPAHTPAEVLDLTEEQLDEIVQVMITSWFKSLDDSGNMNADALVQPIGTLMTMSMLFGNEMGLSRRGVE